MAEQRRGVLAKLLAVGAASVAAGHTAAAKEFPAFVPQPRVRFRPFQVMAADDLNRLVERIEALEARVGGGRG